MSLSARGWKLYKAWNAYRHGDAICRYKPLRLWVEPTNYCNLKCTMCPNGTENRTPRGYMLFSQYKEVINQAAGSVNDIHLCHRGESLLHPDIVRMVAYAHTQGIGVRMNTNGTLMTPSLGEELMEAGLDFISFSFDGLDRESYESIRRGARFDDTVARISEFMEAKSRRRGRSPFVMIEALDTGDAERLQEKSQAFLKAFSGLPLDAFRIKSMHNWGGNLKAAGHDDQFAYVPCSNIWYALTVGWDGAIAPCPQDWYFKEALGNIEDMPLSYVWNSPRMMAIRKHIASRQPEMVQICSQCDLLWRRTTAGLPRLNLGPFVAEQLVGYGRLRRLMGRFT